MCNLYSQTRNVEAIRRLFKIGHNLAADIKPQTSIFPGHTAPVIRRADDGERELVQMSWGFVFKPADGKAWRRVTNVRDDTVLKSSFWKPSFEQRRCLVPRRLIVSPIAASPRSGTGSPSTAMRIAGSSPFLASGNAGTAQSKRTARTSSWTSTRL
jgi:SOS response associated peptidase (SRAP)